MATDLPDVKRARRQVALDESQARENPISQFDDWFRQAVNAHIDMPEAMVLATAGADGTPTARYVLLKGYDERGFVFYTHSVSVKGRQIAENPHAALVFYWASLHRQVRIEGDVEQVTDREADEYFATREYGSRVSVWVAPQSSVVDSRQFLEHRFEEFERRFRGAAVPRPETWVGYRVRPGLMEFWQGRDNRLHDRIRYTRRGDGTWLIERLAP